MSKRIIGIDERPPLAQFIPLSLQHMFAMFGASVLVPILFGIDASIVLFMNGVGTLIFIVVTKGRAPAYLGSSFAFIAPTLYLIQNHPAGFRAAQGGFVAVGLAGCVVAFIIYKCGTNWIDIVLPPAAMGPVVALIGLELAGSAAETAGLVGVEQVDPRAVVVFLVTLGFAVFGQVLFRGFLGVIPILIAIIAGYLSCFLTGLVTIDQVVQQVTAPSALVIPHFQTPVFDAGAILVMMPALLVILSEHIGHQVVTSEIVDRNLIRDPGLHRSIFGDNFSTALSGFLGSVPTTTYGENIGVMAVTGVYSVWVIGGAAVCSILLSFIGPVAALINSIPGAVIGGISFLLYGMIGTSGLRILVDQKVDYGKSRNLAMTSVIFVTGLSGIAINLGATIQITGMALAALVGMGMGLVFYLLDKLKLTNDRDA
ncbi:MAG TPA: uracil permease [Candidatus Anaerotruncus excrementipullorum]|uniref:Uracil permease n=1 Tax=Candidatus Anaerotruncus excrementipullorum TaxID=2838465 RepID=A0A9D1WSD5_9FIRM|nr:uracil permease [Candidatus Anaerotruncus excrementipullorum]